VQQQLTFIAFVCWSPCKTGIGTFLRAWLAFFEEGYFSILGILFVLLIRKKAKNLEKTG
jgi:membrane protein DedA with SNARE-associated domain